MSGSIRLKDIPGTSQREPDVYETSDLPEAEQQTASPYGQPTSDNEHIAQEPINVAAAMQCFKGKQLDSHEADFSDSLKLSSRRGYGTLAASELMNVDETAEQKFHRLQQELRDLTDLCGSEKPPADASTTVVSLTALAKLQSQLKEIQMEQIFGIRGIYETASTPAEADALRSLALKLKAVRSEQAAVAPKQNVPSSNNLQNRALFDVAFSPSFPATANVCQFADVESRIARMESIVGTDFGKMGVLAGGTESQKSLMKVICQLNDKVQLLDTVNLDMVDARCSGIVAKLSQIREKKNEVDVETKEKISHLYELTKKWDNVCSKLPQVVLRLKALSALHEQAMQFTQAITQLSAVQQLLVKNLETNSSAVSEVRDSLNQNMDIIEKNVKSLDDRLKLLKH